MNKLNLRNRKKGVTPVIATIILIAGTLVLALVVGAYTFGLFGSNVKTVTLTSGNLFAGSADTKSAGYTTACATLGETYMTVALNNPGAATTLTSISITGTALNGVQLAAYYTSGSCTSVSSTAVPLSGGVVSSLTFYFQNSTNFSPASLTTGSLTSGQTYNYVINLQNGQSVSGSLIAQ